MHADTNQLQWCHWIYFCLSICLPISVSLSCIQMCLSLLLSVRLHIVYPISPHLFLLHLWYFLYVCMMFLPNYPSFCPSLSLSVSNPHSLHQGLPEHSKPLARCQAFVWLICSKTHHGEGKNTKNPSKFFVLGKREGWKKVLDFYLYVCKKK